MWVKILQTLWTAFGGEIINAISSAISDYFKKQKAEKIAADNLAAQKDAAAKGDLDALANTTDNLINNHKP